MSEVLEFARILRREWVAAADSPTGALARALDAAIAEYESTRGRESGAGGTVAPSEGCAPRTPPERVAPAPSTHFDGMTPSGSVDTSHPAPSLTAEAQLAKLREPLTVADASNLAQVFSRTAVGQQLAPTRQEVNAMRAVVREFLRVRGVQG